MKKINLFLLLFLFGHIHFGISGSDEVRLSSKPNGDVYAYFAADLGDDVGKIGPTDWKNLFRIEKNQCGGYGQKDGFGQSPVIIPNSVIYGDLETQTAPCYGSILEFETEVGNCTYADFEFHVRKDGLELETKKDVFGYPLCHIGRVKRPGDNHYFDAIKIRMSLGGEHTFEGYYTAGEMQIYHQSRNSDEILMFTLLVEIFPVDYTDISQLFSQFDEGMNPFYEFMLQGWENKHDGTANSCTTDEDGNNNFNANTVMQSQQKLLQCKAVSCDSACYKETYIGEEFSSAASDELIPNIYEPGPDSLLMKDYGLISYRGSLTSPPCTENVYWNIADTEMIISLAQMQRTKFLVLCFVDDTRCKHASAASEFGVTSRPPQDLNGRQLLHYCQPSLTFGLPAVEEIAEEQERYKMPYPKKPYYGVLFPSFIVILGVVVFFLLTRYAHMLPYTAVLFLLGTMIGIGIVMNDGSHDQLTESSKMWENINSELLLLVFLPGLLFKDAYSLDIHLFRKSFGQILIMAFPMVLAGTSLMALVGYYLLPYKWNFNLAMTFGAILSATDPVAVSALLNELGAPPRLKMHISGESLLNDGSAIVFFSIFKSLYLYEVDVAGGHNISFGEGVAKFLKMSAGAAATGAAFGFALVVILFLLNRRLNGEESIVQVSATISFAYLSYYVAEAVYHMSGVIAVVFCGVVTKAFAASLIIDQDMMSKFWVLVEHLLNTILFVLGGVVWGTVISNRDESRQEQFTGTDWGYLFLVYVLMSIIRFGLFGAFFPIISKIGLKSKWKEMVFQSFGGLRGAVGIALAISLDNEVIRSTVRIDPRRRETSELFAITGGISLLTLFINGTLAGPLLKKLNLGRASVARQEVTKRYEDQIKTRLMNQFVILLGKSSFAELDFGIVRKNISQLSSISLTELKLAIRRVKDFTPIHLYNEPDLSMLESYFKNEKEEFEKVEMMAKKKLSDSFRSAVRTVAYNLELSNEAESFKTDMDSAEDEKLMELRLVFIELLGHKYKEDMVKGQIDVRYSSVIFKLQRSLAITEDNVSNGEAIEDWEECQTAVLKCCSKSKVVEELSLALAFIQAHEEGQKSFLTEFCQGGMMSNVERQVLEESRTQVDLARNFIESVDSDATRDIMTFLLCSILLNNVAIFVKEFVGKGLLKETEGEHYFEHIEYDLEHLRKHYGL